MCACLFLSGYYVFLRIRFVGAVCRVGNSSTVLRCRSLLYSFLVCLFVWLNRSFGSLNKSEKGKSTTFEHARTLIRLRPSGQQKQINTPNKWNEKQANVLFARVHRAFQCVYELYNIRILYEFTMHNHHQQHHHRTRIKLVKLKRAKITMQ